MTNSLLLVMVAIGMSLSGLLLPTMANAGVVVIGHPSNNNALTAKQLKKIFLGKVSSFPSGGSAVPFDQKPDTTAHQGFYKKVVKKNGRKLKSYWSKLMFSGKKQPPAVVDGDAQMIEKVAADPSAIGYIEESALNGDTSVKVLFKVPS